MGRQWSSQPSIHDLELPMFRLSHLGGVVFAIGWWVWIDAWVAGKLNGTIPTHVPATSTQYVGNTTVQNASNVAAQVVQTRFEACWTMGVLCPFGGLLLNTIGWDALTATENRYGQAQAKTLRCKGLACLFVACIFMVGALAGSVWVLVLAAKHEHDFGAPDKDIPNVAMGVALLLQNFFIMAGAVVLRMEGVPS